MTQPLSIQEFAAKIKAKYPDYANVPDEELTTRIVEKYPDYAPMVNLQSNAAQAPDPAAEIANMPEKRFLDSFVQQVNPLEAVKVLQAIYESSDALAVPKLLIGQPGAAEFQSAKDAFAKGDYKRALNHTIGWAIPLIGPNLAAQQEKGFQGDYAGMFGGTLGMITSLFAPGALAKLKEIRVTPKLKNPNPAEQAAVEFGMKEGIPVDAATATGSKVVRGTQWLSDRTLGGEFVTRGAERQRAAAMTRTGNKLADTISPTPVTPEGSGRSVTSALEGKIARFKQDADFAYNSFRQMEQQTPVNVDMRQIKAELKPVYDDMSKWMEPAKRNASQGYTAIKSIVEGPDFIPASQAEKGLGGLKGLAREADPNMADVNQALGKMGTSKLQAAIDDAVQNTLGQRGIDTLNNARAAHRSKMTVADVLGDLRDEPVQVFNQAAWGKDAGIDRLREVAKHAPQEMKKIGRAWLDNVLEKATSKGGFDHADSMWTQWQNLGPETKKILFSNPALISDLDKFFLLAKKMAENPNPSGTAFTAGIGAQGALLVTNPVIGITYQILGAGVSKLLHSPKGAKLLLNGMKIPLGNKAAAALATAELLKMAGKDAVPIQLPATAELHPEAPEVRR